MRHVLFDQWKIPEHQNDSNLYCIEIDKLFPLVNTGQVPKQTIPFDDISHHIITTANTSGFRFESADVRFPGIVVENMPNPHNRKYRLIDGKHRLAKQWLNGHTHGPFYVFQYEFIKPLIELHPLNDTNWRVYLDKYTIDNIVKQ